VKNLFRLLCSIPLLFVGSHANAIKLLTTNEACPPQPAAYEVIRSLPVAYPKDWTIVVTCTESEWQYVRRKADAMQTNNAFTNLEHRITIIHGQIFLDPPQFRPAQLILLHELGHITCRCDSEDKAEDWARKLYK
jgi:hypothetical protein